MNQTRTETTLYSALEDFKSALEEQVKSLGKMQWNYEAIFKDFWGAMLDGKKFIIINEANCRLCSSLKMHTDKFGQMNLTTSMPLRTRIIKQNSIFSSNLLLYGGLCSIKIRFRSML